MNWRGIPITDGTGQQDRQPAPFAPDYFRVDGFKFEQLLALGAEFASVMKFYNLGNEVDGDWGELFNADEAVLMADIIALDLKRLGSDFRGMPYDDMPALLDFVLELAVRINFWYVRLSASQQPSAELLANNIATLIADKLKVELHKLYQIAHLAEIQSLSVAQSQFAALWGLEPGVGADPLSRSTTDWQERGDIYKRLSDSFYVFSNSIVYLKKRAEVCLEKSLKSERHDPSMGLFIVFVKLYQKAQQRLNRFTLRHLDFYYRQILLADNQPAVAESCYLLLESREGSDRVVIEKGAEFSAGQDAEFNDIIYTADEELLLGDARLAALATLYLQHDDLVSPESALGFVTRIKADQPQVLPAAPVADKTPARASSWPLFGAEQPGGNKGNSGDARIGFSIASAVLLLEQGVRKIDIAIELEDVSRQELDNQLSTLLDCNEQQDFKRQFGGLFARYLLSYEGGLQQVQKDQIVARARSLSLPENLLREIADLLEEDWQGLFYKLFKKAFDLRLTTQDGWLAVPDYYLQPLAGSRRTRQTGFRLTLSLGQEVLPIVAYNPEVHGAQLQTGLPVLQCLVNPRSDFCSYSVFQDLVIESLRIDVEVSGIKNLLLYNHHGQLDPSKPFQPFGPLPGRAPYLVFGSYELACKQLQAIKISLDWAELPRIAGGFEEHYLGYDTDYRNAMFQAEFSALVDSRWLPDEAAARPRFSLFESTAKDDSVAAQKLIEIDQLDYIKPVDAGLSRAGYRYDLGTRKGFYRFSLVAPDTGFGHAEYGQLLTRVLSANAKLKKPLPIPNPPYTPTLNGISLAYRASSAIHPSRAHEAAGPGSDKVFHLHPFGVQAVFPPESDTPCYLLPQYAHEGNLFIGLAGTNIPGPLSLLFHLSQDLVQSTVAGHKGISWYYLAANRWKKLQPRQILTDSTYGFHAPGKVTLNIPPDIDKGNSVMPGEYYWLRVSVEQEAGAFSSCYSIKPHALKVSRRQRHQAQAVEPDATPERSWSSIIARPEISNITQAYSAFGGRHAESDNEFKVRVSERLRHKNRAQMPWDYEQLILEQFPEIIKVKCFNSISSTEDRIKPGQVLIVVVPETRQQSGAGCAHEMINTRKLEQIKAYIKNLCSPFVSLEVRNPQYEQVQVRCTVKFADTDNEGLCIERLNQQISDYICPWKAKGYKARFGWSIRQQDIESHISSLDYVGFVTNFSMLHITVDNSGKYELFDTAKSTQQSEVVITPRYPWSLALPVETHFIETRQIAEVIPAEITGVDELAVGSTFIIVGSSENGEEE